MEVIMAQLTESDQKMYDKLTRDERQKFWLLHKKDEDLKNEFEALNFEWDNETDSAAVKYLRKLKLTKCCSSSADKTLSKSKMECANVAEVDENSSSEQSEEEFSDDSDDRFSDAETVVASARASNETGITGLAQAAFSGEMKIKLKVYPKTTLRGEVVLSRNRDGFYKQVSKGYVSGWEVAVKVINVTQKDMGEKEIRAIQKIIGLNHRNLISMIGILDSAMNQPMQLLFDYRDVDTSLLEFVRDVDDNPKDYATFGKFSLDVANACEYLHKIGVVHGSLAARNVIIRTAKSKYDTKFKSHFKTHFNALISDYGIIHFTDGLGYEFFKASNGKVVPLRWVPEEILGSDVSCIDYTPESDVWGLGVTLWEMWTHGDVPYGNLTENWEVQNHILNGCSPLTFQKPNACPKHILKVMEDIFVDAAKGPTMSDLVKKFEGFRTYRQEHSLDASKERTSNSKETLSRDTAYTSSYMSKHLKYQNSWEQRKQYVAASGSQMQTFSRQNHGGSNTFYGHSSDGKGKTNCRPRPYGKEKAEFDKVQGQYFNSSSKPRFVPVLCPTSMLCGNNKSTPFTMQEVPMNSFHAGMQTMHNSITSLQNQIQALSCTRLSRDHAPPSSSVSVNIGNQRPYASASNAYQRPLAQPGQVRPQSQGQGVKNRNTAVTKKKPKNNNNNKKTDQIQ